MSVDNINPNMESSSLRRSLRRSQSLASVSSLTMPIDCDYTDHEPIDIIAHGMSIIKIIIESAPAKKQSKLEKSAKCIRKIFKELDKRETQRQQEVEEQNRRMNNLENALIKHEYAEQALKNDLEQYKQILNGKLQDLPTKTQIKELIQESTQELINIKSGSLSLPPPEAEHQPNLQETSESQDNRRDHSRRGRSPSPGIDRIHLRTLIVRGIHQRIKSKQIKEDFTKAKFFTAHPIERTIYKQYHLEVVCKTPTAAEKIKRELQTNQKLNKHLVFLTKTAHTEKMILLKAPPEYSEEHIKQSILKKYKAYRDEIKILAAQKSRKDPEAKDWILVLPLDLGRATVRGGIDLGVHHCNIRPHTSVQRCTKCQDYGHNQRRCENNAYCANCGEKHPPRECSDPPGCINCKISNRDDKTRHHIGHRANSTNCPIFRQVYGEERERLDSLFKFQQTTNPHQQTREEPPYNHYGGPPSFWSPPWTEPPQLFGHWPQFQSGEGFESFEQGSAPQRGGDRRPQYNVRQDLNS